MTLMTLKLPRFRKSGHHPRIFIRKQVTWDGFDELELGSTAFRQVCLDRMSFPKEEVSGGGEFEIEKVHCHEIEVRRKDLLPLFDHFHSIKSDWIDRDGEGYRSASLLEASQERNKASDESSKLASVSSHEL